MNSRNNHFRIASFLGQNPFSSQISGHLFLSQFLCICSFLSSSHKMQIQLELGHSFHRFLVPNLFPKTNVQQTNPKLSTPIGETTFQPTKLSYRRKPFRLNRDPNNRRSNQAQQLGNDTASKHSFCDCRASMKQLDDELRLFNFSRAVEMTMQLLLVLKHIKNQAHIPHWILVAIRHSSTIDLTTQLHRTKQIRKLEQKKERGKNFRTACTAKILVLPLLRPSPFLATD